MTHHWTSAKLGLPPPRRLSVFYLDAGQPRVIRDRAEGLLLLLADLRRTEREIVGLGSDAQARQALGAAGGSAEPRKEHVKL